MRRRCRPGTLNSDTIKGPGSSRSLFLARYMIEYVGRIPKGFRNKAQGCEGRATLGKGGRCFTTPTGLRPRWAVVGVCPNPFRVVIDRARDPRVARSSQPWALLRNPFGIRRRTTDKVVRGARRSAAFMP